MDQKIKNFDRSIEQKMNEHEVAPPFGMWNRISSELEGMPLPVAAAAPAVGSMIPKRALLGIIAAALVLSTSMITGYLVNSSLSHNQVNVQNNGAGKQQIAASTTATKPMQTVGVKDLTPAVNPVTAKAKVKHSVAANPVQSTLQLAQQAKPAINQPVTVSNNETNSSVLLADNAATDVPTPIEPVAQNVQETQTYYFPPIDVNTPEKAKVSNETAVAKNKNKATASNDNDGPSERKFRFRPHRRTKFTYGNIIR